MSASTRHNLGLPSRKRLKRTHDSSFASNTMESPERGVAKALKIEPSITPKPSKATAEAAMAVDVCKDIQSIVTCKICFRLLHQPYTTSCGHTFCYTCLSHWFNESKYSCPDCRTEIREAPAPAYMIREITQRLAKLPAADSELSGEEEEAKAVEKDRDTTGLFKGVFPRHRNRITVAARQLISDLEDGVTRCPWCSWEYEEGEGHAGRCLQCGERVSRYVDDESEDEDYEDEELDDELTSERDFDADIPDHGHLGALLNGFQGVFDPRAIQDHSFSIGSANEHRRTSARATSTATSYSGSEQGREWSIPSVLRDDEDDDDEEVEEDEDSYSSLNGFVVSDDEVHEGSDSSMHTTSTSRPAAPHNRGVNSHQAHSGRVGRVRWADVTADENGIILMPQRNEESSSSDDNEDEVDEHKWNTSSSDSGQASLADAEESSSDEDENDEDEDEGGPVSNGMRRRS